MTGLPALPDDYRLERFETLDSTNAELKRRAEAGEGGGPLIAWTLEQTQGRGRRGRSWSGPSGNLMCSVLLWPKCGLPVAAQLSFVAALAVLDLARAALPGHPNISLKWPNDVLVDGRKISGILLEAGGWMPGASGWIVVGTGVNLVQHPLDTEWPATDIAAEGGERIPPERALELYCEAFERWRRRWAEEGFEPVRHRWLEWAHGLGERIAARMDRETVEGEFEGIGQDGSLVLNLGNGKRRHISAADIFPAAG